MKTLIMCNERDFDAEWKARMRQDTYIRRRLEALQLAERQAAIERARRALEESQRREEEEMRQWLEQLRLQKRRNTL